MNAKPVANAFKRVLLPLFGPLPVADVDGGSVRIACGKRGANARIHTTAKQHDGAAPAPIQVRGCVIRKHRNYCTDFMTGLTWGRTHSSVLAERSSAGPRDGRMRPSPRNFTRNAGFPLDRAERRGWPERCQTKCQPVTKL